MIILKILLFNISVLLANQVNEQSMYLHKGDSCFREVNYDCAAKYYSKIDLKAFKFESKEEELYYYLKYSDALYAIGNFQEANISYQVLQSLASQNKNEYYKGKAHTGRAHSLWRMTDNVNAIEEILKGIAIFESRQDTSNLIIASNILAGIYVSIGKLHDAHVIYENMLDIARQSNDSANIAGNLEYIGIIDFYKGDFKEAIRNYEKSLDINIRLNNFSARAINLSNLAEAYMELGQYQKALKILKEADRLQMKLNIKSVLIFTRYTLGKIYTQLHKYDSGIYYYENSLRLMDQTGEVRDRPEVCRLMAENFAQRGNFEKAYKFHQLFSVHKDSLIASERTRQLEEIKTLHQVERKIKENEDLLSQNYKKEEELSAQKELIQLQFTIGILIIIFLIISLFLAYKLYKVRQILLNANNSKDKLFGIIAHDLKGPIGNVSAMLNLLQKEQDEKIKSQYLNYLAQSVSNLSTLTNQLLSWTFSHKGDFNFKMEKLSVRKITDRTIELFDSQLSEKNISIHNSISDELYVCADENALLTIVRNILSNAVKFTKRNGKIYLEAEDQKQHVEVRLQDSGVGMAQSTIQKILEGKHVASSEGTANEKGSGLGFSIVIEFIKRLNGSIDISSDQNSGTTVILKLKK